MEKAQDSAAHARQAGQDEDQRGGRGWTWLIPAALIGLLISLYFVLPAYQGFVDKAYSLLTSNDLQAFRRWVQAFGAWGPAVIFALMIMQTLLAFIPSVLIMVVTIVAYGPWWGGALAWGGLMLAALVGYGVGRALGPATVHRLIGKNTEEKIEGFVGDYGVWAIVAARVSPALSTDAVSFVAGIVQMSVWRFLLATGLGILPLTVAIAYLGADFARLGSGLVWISVLSVGVFLGYVIYDKTRDA